MKKKISILGSTGSIGLTTLTIIGKMKNSFKINILLANKNYKNISNQIKKYKPEYFIIKDKKVFLKIKKKFKKNKVKILNNLNISINQKKSDITVSAIPGIAGLEPTIQMTQLSKKILLANKESIICGWNLIRNAAKKNNTKVVPVDSEHFSIMNLLSGHKLSEIEKIFITASGGPFLNFKVNQLKKISPQDALNHPKWKMGKKITVDSSTLINKIFELVEAQKLFNLPKEKLEILIHPNSLVHAIIKFKNGISKLIYHDTSMIIPLGNAITDNNFEVSKFYKVRKKINNTDNLIFRKVDEKIFPIIKLKNRVNEHPSSPIIVNAANEILVDQFLKHKIPFLRINKIILSILKDRNYKKYAIRTPRKINQIYKIDHWARELTYKKINKKNV